MKVYLCRTPHERIRAVEGGDIKYLAQVAIKYTPPAGQPKDYSIFVLTLTIPGGTYAIKIKDVSKFSELFTNNEDKYNKALKSLEDEYIKIGTTDVEKLKKALLKTMRKFNMGVGLYEASPDLSNWSELSISPLDSPTNPKEIIKTPCK